MTYNLLMTFRQPLCCLCQLTFVVRGVIYETEVDEVLPFFDVLIVRKTTQM